MPQTNRSPPSQGIPGEATGQSPRRRGRAMGLQTGSTASRSQAHPYGACDGWSAAAAP